METRHRPPITRVVLTGSESTGKTTLARQLAEAYGVEWVPEFVRDFAAARGRAIEPEDHDAIAHGQIAREDEYVARADSLLIQDTDLLSTVVYGAHYTGDIAPSIEAAARARRPSLYLLMDIDVPWIADGVRDRGNRREEVQALFRSAVEASGAPFVVVSGSTAERQKVAISAIDRCRVRSPY